MFKNNVYYLHILSDISIQHIRVRSILYQKQKGILKTNLQLAESEINGVSYSQSCLVFNMVRQMLMENFSFVYLIMCYFSGLLFPKFRYGWSLSLQAIPQKPSKKPSLTTFMLIAKKESSPELQKVSSSIHSATGLYGDQVIYCIFIIFNLMMRSGVVGMNGWVLFDE